MKTLLFQYGKHKRSKMRNGFCSNSYSKEVLVPLHASTHLEMGLQCQRTLFGAHRYG